MQHSSKPPQYASPPCFMHELPASGGGEHVASKDWMEVRRWRKEQRKLLIAARMAKSQIERQACSDGIVRKLDRTIKQFAGKVIGIYWPVRGEPDLRNWGIEAIDRGGRLALPVVTEKGAPLEYRLWTPGDPLERGVWNILVPAGGSAVQPDVVIAPLVGFDARSYRLGYGGGYFDRTLAAISAKPRTIGVGYADCALTSIFPQPHDIPMDEIITS